MPLSFGKEISGVDKTNFGGLVEIPRYISAISMLFVKQVEMEVELL